jgi:hypothetical protein
MFLDWYCHRHGAGHYDFCFNPAAHRLADWMMTERDERFSSLDSQSVASAPIELLQAFYDKRNIRIPKSIPMHILAHGRRIILGLERGFSYINFKGKRLSPDRKMVSIPVGRRWRLLAKYREGKTIPVRLLSHETYNHKQKWNPE